jgi:hypothetical protein
MSNLVTTIHDNSEKFLPAFARLKATNPGKRTTYDPLDFARLGTTPQPSVGETEVGRWVALSGCIFTITEDGAPFDTAPAGATGRPVKLFEGGAELLLTDRRLMGVVVRGETIVGKVGDQRGSVLLFTLPLTRVDSLRLDLGRRLFGGIKEKRLHIMSVEGTVADVVIDEVVAAPGPGPKGLARYRGTLRQVLDAFVAAVAAARRAGADDEELRQLDALVCGAREETADEVVANF